MLRQTEPLEKAKKHFKTAGLTPADITAIQELLENLEKKVEDATIKDVECFIEDLYLIIVKIVDSQTAMDEFENGIGALAENHTALFKVLLKAYVKAKQFQNKFEEDKSLIAEVEKSIAQQDTLKSFFLLPMLFSLARSSPFNYMSAHLGWVTYVTLDESLSNSAANIFFSIDDEMAAIGERSPLQVYAMSMFYLNRENHQRGLFSKKFTLEKKEGEVTTRPMAPKLLFVTPEMMTLFSEDTDHFEQTVGCVLSDKQLIIISIDETTSIKKIFPRLMHEMQHLYLDYLNEGTSCLFLRGISEPIIQRLEKIVQGLIKASDPNTQIFLDIIEILRKINTYNRFDKNINELSAYLTSLLVAHHPKRIQAALGILLSEVEKVAQGEDPLLSLRDELLLAYSLVERALLHMSSSLHSLIKSTSRETLQVISDENESMREDLTPVFDVFNRCADNEPDWEACLIGIRNYEQANLELLAATSYSNPSFSIHHQALIGNVSGIRKLHDLNKPVVNALDKKDLPSIFYAVIGNQRPVVMALLDLGASLNWQGEVNDVKQRTLLHLAGFYGSSRAIPILLSRGLSATAKDAKNKSPLLLFCLHLTGFAEKKLRVAKADYKQYIYALTCLLSYNDEPEIHILFDNPSVLFFNALKDFQKKLALLFVLQSTGALRSGLDTVPLEIVPMIAARIIHSDAGHMRMINSETGKIYGNCYEDIVLVLLQDKKLFNLFLMQGIKLLYSHFESIKKSDNFLEHAREKLLNIILPFDLLIKSNNTKTLSTETKLERLKSYFSPAENLLRASESLAAVTMAKKNLQQVKTFFQSKNDRRLAIATSKRMVVQHEDAALAQTILQACKEMGLIEIDNKIYHELASILRKLVIKENKAPVNYSPGLFARELKERYEERISRGAQDAKVAVIKPR